MRAGFLFVVSLLAAYPRVPVDAECPFLAQCLYRAEAVAWRALAGRRKGTLVSRTHSFAEQPLLDLTSDSIFAACPQHLGILFGQSFGLRAPRVFIAFGGREFVWVLRSKGLTIETSIARAGLSADAAFSEGQAQPRRGLVDPCVVAFEKYAVLEALRCGEKLDRDWPFPTKRGRIVALATIVVREVRREDIDCEYLLLELALWDGPPASG